MTRVHPYVAWTNGNAELWGSVGYGQGKLEIVQTRSDKSSTDTNLLSLAVGGQGHVATSGGVNLKSDIALVNIDIDASANGKISKQNLTRQRLRLLLEVSRDRQLTSGILTPSLEVGARYDAGTVFGAGVHYANTTSLIVEGRYMPC